MLADVGAISDLDSADTKGLLANRASHIPVVVEMIADEHPAGNENVSANGYRRDRRDMTIIFQRGAGPNHDPGTEGRAVVDRDRLDPRPVADGHAVAQLQALRGYQLDVASEPAPTAANVDPS
ncbi:MAG TPA: hypothetical protein VHT75_15870 [Acidimicrobiales bacterium]|nr:hypothetical protein [Acidimicrobiales bacterium]